MVPIIEKQLKDSIENQSKEKNNQNEEKEEQNKQVEDNTISKESEIDTYLKSRATISKFLGSIEGKIFFEGNKCGSFNVFMRTLVKVQNSFTKSTSKNIYIIER